MSDILLVHGAWHGPWCWDNFIRHLTERKHQVRTVRLRGHDTPGRIWYRVRHYVDDVRDAVSEFADPPVLIGHSLGGLVIQKYLEHNPAPAAVLMASIPPRGTVGAVLRLALKHPVPFLKANLSLRLRPLVDRPKLVRDLFFTPDTPQATVDYCFQRLQDESYLAFIDTMVSLARPSNIKTPMLVLGAERDTIFTVDEVRRTAHAYGIQAEIFPGMGHDMMLDEGWQHVADRIDVWLQGIRPVDFGGQGKSLTGHPQRSA